MIKNEFNKGVSDADFAASKAAAARDFAGAMIQKNIDHQRTKARTKARQKAIAEANSGSESEGAQKKKSKFGGLGGFLKRHRKTSPMDADDAAATAGAGGAAAAARSGSGGVDIYSLDKESHCEGSRSDHGRGGGGETGPGRRGSQGASMKKPFTRLPPTAPPPAWPFRLPPTETAKEKAASRRPKTVPRRRARTRRREESDSDESSDDEAATVVEVGSNVRARLCCSDEAQSEQLDFRVQELLDVLRTSPDPAGRDATVEAPTVATVNARVNPWAAVRRSSLDAALAAVARALGVAVWAEEIPDHVSSLSVVLPPRASTLSLVPFNPPALPRRQTVRATTRRRRRRRRRRGR